MGPSRIKTDLLHIQQMERQLRDLKRELLEKKSEMFRKVLQEMGPEGAINSGVISLNMGRVRTIFGRETA